MRHRSNPSAICISRPERIRPKQGAVAVEMALTLPILFLLLFAIFEVGRANMIRHATEAAAYEGARVGIVAGSTPAEMRTAAERILTTVGVDDFQITVTPNPIVSDTREVTVDIKVPLDQNMTAARFVNGLEFTGHCTLTRELISDLQN